MQHPFHDLVLPPFEMFVIAPNNSDCPAIDPKRLIIEILWGGTPSNLLEANDSQWHNIEGSHALIFRYRRTQNTEPRVASILSFNVSREHGIEIVQLQWTKDRHVGYRFNSSFELMSYILLIMEKTFLVSGIPVRVTQFPTGIEWASYAAKSIDRYEILRTALAGRMVKYSSLQEGDNSKDHNSFKNSQKETLI
jgi:hypothetical protein